MSNRNEAVESYALMLEGQKAAALCNRYQYRGIVGPVRDTANNIVPGGIMFVNATAVEVSGPTERSQPNTEDAIGGPIVISSDMIEILYQPMWCHAPLPGEDGWSDNRDS